ncbi:hypothetical protein HYV73_03870 [Candidatus Uhrbacteria bacterium]|nr:hypothetical protein [Candidatus Uhrbacteria bacterium]
MFKFGINGTPVYFQRFFNDSDRELLLEALGQAMPQRVLFIDTPSTPVLAQTIEELVKMNVEGVVRDHHRSEGRNPEAAERVELILGSNAQIVLRKDFPGCAQLVQLGEFVGIDLVIADPDLDGLLGAMKALGVSYEGLDKDAPIFDVRPQQNALNLSELGWLVCRAMSTLPPFNKEKPQISEDAKAKLFENFVKAASGNAAARSELEGAVAAYEAAVEGAKKVLETTVEVAPAVWLVDSRGTGKFDLNTVTGALDKKGAKVTVTIKSEGPIAAKTGSQVSLAVVEKYQIKTLGDQGVDLRRLAAGQPVGLEVGLLSNTDFLLHCSEAVWESAILPALKASRHLGPTAQVRAAIAATKLVPSRNEGSPSYWADCLAMRAGDSEKRLGSIYPNIGVEELEKVVLAAEWAPYAHSSINAPAQGFRAALAGEMGVDSIDNLPSGTELVLNDQKGTGKLMPVAVGLPRSSVNFTVALVGPGDNGQIIWTFFPGDPIRESTLTTENNQGLKHGDKITIAQARELGLEFVKVG